MVYTSLQFIARGREQGISVLELGKKSGYDQKTCFYLVKQLVELDLVYVLASQSWNITHRGFTQSQTSKSGYQFEHMRP